MQRCWRRALDWKRVRFGFEPRIFLVHVMLLYLETRWSGFRSDEDQAQQTRCSEPGDSGLVGNRDQVAPGR